MTGEGTPSQSTAGSPEVQPHDVAAPTAATVGSMPPGSTATASTGSLRASDLDRNALVQQLAKATGEGRITLEEFADAAGAAYAAVTLAELDDLHRSFGLTALLPPPPDAARTATATATATAPFDTAPLASTPASAPLPVGARHAEPSPAAEHVVAIMSGADRRGRWQVRRRTRAVAVMGGVTLDLRDAVIESDVVEIEAWAVMGGVTVLVPEGIPVELSGCVIMGGRSSRVEDVPILPGAPTIRVRARGLWGGVDVRSKRSRRTVHGATAPSSVEPEAGRRSAHQPHADHRNRERDRTAKRQRNGSRPGRPTTSGDLLTVVCTDIVGSTRLAVSLGDQRWHSVLTAHNEVVRQLLHRYGGTEVKTSGDGFLLTFTSARAALQFSMELQDEVAAERAARPEAPIELRIGVHAGEVERDGADIIGRNVTIACRLCDAAAPGEVLASSVVADLADSASDLVFGVARQHTLAGIEHPLVARPAARA